MAQAQPKERSNLILPAGTRIPLVLTHPIQSRLIHRGDNIYAQITGPVTSGNEVAIPPGSFIQGKVDKLGRKGDRGELRLQSMSITFPNGYVAPISGPVTLESDEGYAVKDPGKGRVIGGVTLPVAGFGLGALIGHSLASSQSSTITSSLPPGCTGPPPGCLTSSLTVPPEKGESTAIGSAVGGAIGLVGSLLMLATSHNFYLDVGSPVEMTLQQPLSLDWDQVADAVSHSQDHPVQPIVPAPSTTTNTSNSGKPPWDCSAGQEWCGGSCVDTIRFINDSSNCGRCGNRCSIGESCMGGTCMRTTPCAPGDISCH